jgi:hypothetical protein
VPQVNFEQLSRSPRKYEDMVSVLLSRLYQTRRVDGTGGDGGRDCYFSDERGTDAYELKSFTGRMAQPQRRQVKRSMDRAMKKAPRTWTLVVPIDPTPQEQQWFDSLRAGVPAQLEWRGKTWLEEKLAQYPDITRYFSGAADEVVRLLSEVAREDALPDDAAALAEKLAGAVSRLNEIDPYYRFDYTVTGDATTVTAHPKYPDAPRDRPIRVSTILRFDASPASLEVRAAMEDFMLFGTRVIIPDANVAGLVIDAPGGLGGEFSGGELILDGTFQPTPEAASAVLLRIPPNPPVRHSVRLNVTSRSSGPAGGLRMIAQDSSSLLSLDQRFNLARHTYQAHLTYKYHDGVLPQDAVPVLRFCAALAVGEQMAFTDPHGNVFATGSGAFGPADWPEAYIRCAETLAEVQQLAGAFFPLPPSFTPEDHRDMYYARTLLRGEEVHAKWSGLVAPLTADLARSLLEQIQKHGEPFMFGLASEVTVEVAGGQVRLGWIFHATHSTRMANLDEVKAWYQAGAQEKINVRLEPAGNDDMTQRLMQGEPPAPETAGQS